MRTSIALILTAALFAAPAAFLNPPTWARRIPAIADLR